VDNVLTSIGYEFLRTDKDGNDGGEELITKQRGFKLVNPSNQWFPGIDKIKAELRSWDWNAGRTPPFNIQRSYMIPNGGEVKLDLSITKGFIGSATLNFSSDVDSRTRADLSGFISALKERPYHPGILTTLEGLLLNKSEFKVFSQEHFRGSSHVEEEAVMESGVKLPQEQQYTSTMFSL
jgi:lipoyltransferase 1